MEENAKPLDLVEVFNRLRRKSLGMELGGLANGFLNVVFPGNKTSYLIDTKGEVFELIGGVPSKTHGSERLQGIVAGKVRLNSGEMVSTDDPRRIEEQLVS